MVLIYSIRTHGTATRRYLSEVRSCTEYIAVHSYYAECSAGVKGYYLRGSGLGPVGDRFFSIGLYGVCTPAMKLMLTMPLTGIFECRYLCSLSGC